MGSSLERADRENTATGSNTSKFLPRQDQGKQAVFVWSGLVWFAAKCVTRPHVLDWIRQRQHHVSGRSKCRTLKLLCCHPLRGSANDMEGTIRFFFLCLSSALDCSNRQKERSTSGAGQAVAQIFISMAFRSL